MSGIAAMRIHVRMFGTVQSIWRFRQTRSQSDRRRSGARVKVIINVSGERRTDTGDFLDVRHPGAHHLLQPPEVLEQGPALGGPQTRHRLQHRFVVPAGAFATVASDGETMRLVADSLYDARCR